MMFHVGQKVVCVDASPCWHNKIHLKKGAVYTIEGFDRCTEPGRIGILLYEIKTPCHFIFGHSIGFRQNRFRPIVERKTDISIFTAMLSPEKQGVEA